MTTPSRIDYHQPTTDAGCSSATAWWAVAGVAAVHGVWYVAWRLGTLGWLEDASPKQPLRDLVLITGAALPAGVVLCACVGVNRFRRPTLPVLITVLIALLVVGSVATEWVTEDVVYRAVPHGLW